MRQKSLVAEDLTAHLAPMPGQEPTIKEESEDLLEEETNETVMAFKTIEEGDDSGTETLHDTDSEPEDQQTKQTNFIDSVVGWNVSLKF